MLTLPVMLTSSLLIDHGVALISGHKIYVPLSEDIIFPRSREWLHDSIDWNILWDIPCRQHITESQYILVGHTVHKPLFISISETMNITILNHGPRPSRQYLVSLFSMEIWSQINGCKCSYLHDKTLALMFVLFMKLLYLWQTSHPPNYCYYLQQWQMISRCNASVW